MINIKMQPKTAQKLSPKIIVIGVGGAGGNAVNNMISSNLEGCEFLVCNTDAQALENTLCPPERQIQLGAHVTGGLGAGSKPEIGKAAAEESLEDVLKHVEGANMAFVTCGMGGGTGTGAAPVIARACRERGILTVGVVTKPFHFEGAHRMRMADSGIEEMQQHVDTLIVIPNQNLFRVANEKVGFAEAFRMADGVLQSGVRGVTDLMVMPGLINLDFADIRTGMIRDGQGDDGHGRRAGRQARRAGRRSRDQQPAAR
jgi:cell division protein FtsZ